MLFLFRSVVFLCYCLFAAISTYAQIGGQRGFEFLRLPSHTRTVALGGMNVSLAQQDINSFLQNPALLDSSMHQQAALNFTSFYTGVPHSSLAYGHHQEGLGTFALGLQYIHYGTFEETDPTGAVLGTFTASDFALSLGYAQRQGPFGAGINMKLVGSQLAGYNAWAMAWDIGGTFRHPEQDLSIGLVLKNIGFTLNSFTGESVALPFDIQAGISFKPTYMPLRFSITAHHLYRFDIAYNDPLFNARFDPLTGAPIPNEVRFADQLFRHMVFGTELLLHRNFHLRFGYNHLIRRELQVENGGAFTGFSGGLAFRVRGFELAFSRATYHAAGGRSYVSLMTDIGRFWH